MAVTEFLWPYNSHGLLYWHVSFAVLNRRVANDVMQSGGIFFLPETPRYLIKKSKHERALKSLVTLRRLPGDHPHVEAELAEIQANYNYEMSLGSASWFECFRGTIGKRLFTGCALQSLQVRLNSTNSTRALC